MIIVNYFMNVIIIAIDSIDIIDIVIIGIDLLENKISNLTMNRLFIFKPKYGYFLFMLKII